MIRLRSLLLALAPLLPLAGCQAVGEKEAQLEFERLRRSTPVQGDRTLPDFGPQSPAGEAFRSGPGSDPKVLPPVVSDL